MQLKLEQAGPECPEGCEEIFRNSLIYERYFQDPGRLEASLHRAAEQGELYLAVSESGELAGFYSLSAHAMERSSIAGGWLQRNVPERVPMILLGMLGVDRRFQGNGLGRRLLHDAVVRSLGISMELGARALIVDPVDDGAARFYEANGFQHIPESERMFLKLAGKRS